MLQIAVAVFGGAVAAYGLIKAGIQLDRDHDYVTGYFVVAGLLAIAGLTIAASDLGQSDPPHHSQATPPQTQAPSQ